MNGTGFVVDLLPVDYGNNVGNASRESKHHAVNLMY